ncbi:hypothetical protein HanHA89_Chr12g0475661 [Helianthus annuus]|nr:hypothetical protein HanHA89_Chr12g0475661 [Helianthus annuus]
MVVLACAFGIQHLIVQLYLFTAHKTCKEIEVMFVFFSENPLASYVCVAQMFSSVDRLFVRIHFIKKCLQTSAHPFPHADMVQCLLSSSNPSNLFFFSNLKTQTSLIKTLAPLLHPSPPPSRHLHLLRHHLHLPRLLPRRPADTSTSSATTTTSPSPPPPPSLPHNNHLPSPP